MMEALRHGHIAPHGSKSWADADEEERYAAAALRRMNEMASEWAGWGASKTLRWWHNLHERRARSEELVTIITEGRQEEALTAGLRKWHNTLFDGAGDHFILEHALGIMRHRDLSRAFQKLWRLVLDGLHDESLAEAICKLHHKDLSQAWNTWYSIHANSLYNESVMSDGLKKMQRKSILKV